MIDLFEKYKEFGETQKILESYGSTTLIAWKEMAREIERMSNPLDLSIFKFLETQQRQLTELLEPYQSYISEAVAGHQKQIEEILRPPKNLEKYFNQMFLETDKTIEALTGISKESPFMNIQKQFEFNSIDFDGMKKLSESLANMNFNFNRDGTLTIEDEMVSTEEIQNKINEIIDDESIDIKKDTIGKTINIFIKFAINTKESIVKIIILGLIINFLSHNVIEPLKEKITKGILKKNKKIVIKKIQTEKFASEIYLLNVRYISAGTLNVRVKNSRKSAKIGELHFGDVVYVITKKRDWSLVLYKNDDVEIKGWVFSRYLKKFNSKVIKISKKIPEDETAYLLRSPKNAARLAEAIEEIEAGKAKERKLIE
ncbi:MAG: SH3 domain-containing protein [Candidatus Aminicenantes bacterium]|nr:SH3 domain-containing protein [Candidatus Aminicenantes bacterium]